MKFFIIFVLCFNFYGDVYKLIKYPEHYSEYSTGSILVGYFISFIVCVVAVVFTILL